MVSKSRTVFRGKVMDNWELCLFPRRYIAVAKRVDKGRGAPKSNPFGGDGGVPISVSLKETVHSQTARCLGGGV